MHLHNALKFVTPAPRRRGKDVDLLAQRQLYQAARTTNPSRRSGPTRDWVASVAVLLNAGENPREKGIADTRSMRSMR